MYLFERILKIKNYYFNHFQVKNIFKMNHYHNIKQVLNKCLKLQPIHKYYFDKLLNKKVF